MQTPHTHHLLHRIRKAPFRGLGVVRTVGVVVSFLLASCTSPDLPDLPYTPRVVVEGRIEHGLYPSVLLSVTAPASGVQDTVSLLQHAIQSALVVVSDGEQDDTLYLRRNSNRLPPFEYRGRNLKGQAGRTYRLRVEYDNDTLTATTRIPAPVPIDSLWFAPRTPGDTLGYLGIRFRNTSADCYRLATAPHAVHDVFTPCLYGNIDSRRYAPGDTICLELAKGPAIYPVNDFRTVYNVHDTIRVQLSTQTRESHDYWNAYQDELLNGQNPLFPAHASLPTNIRGDIGIWAGYGSIQRTVVLRQLPTGY